MKFVAIADTEEPCALIARSTVSAGLNQPA
jgi:hypothetical protein